ncbi:hypothetical protein HZH66_004473 [Vespula vulgaris]|uniref:Uncharacterized protein n=1 Tax=Vespula vulgaris TaxID=7454 RepID=A0A834KGL3_VESVU|nr:hypothetical protein HZH66_004473 [Vespula vulgaris]
MEEERILRFPYRIDLTEISRCQWINIARRTEGAATLVKLSDGRGIGEVPQMVVPTLLYSTRLDSTLTPTPTPTPIPTQIPTHSDQDTTYFSRKSFRKRSSNFRKLGPT